MVTEVAFLMRYFFFNFKYMYVIYTFFSKTLVFIRFEILFTSSEYGAQCMVRKFKPITKWRLVQIFATNLELNTAFHMYLAQLMKISLNNKDIFISLADDLKQDNPTISKTYEAAV